MDWVRNNNETNNNRKDPTPKEAYGVQSEGTSPSDGSTLSSLERSKRVVYLGNLNKNPTKLQNRFDALARQDDDNARALTPRHARSS